MKTLVVIGGGAAGFFCALNAAELNPSLKIILLEKSSKLLSKVKISGGGRCNVTHACFEINDLIKKYPRGQHFLKKAFYQFSTNDTINWFAERQIKLKTEEDGRMFPVSNTSQTIIDCFLKETDKRGISVRLNTEVKSIESYGLRLADVSESTATDNTQNFSGEQSAFQIITTSGSINADAICIASGGYPKLSMFNWLEQLGHTIAAPVPSLFTFNIPNRSLHALMGLSVPHARVKIVGTKLEQEGPMLITHWGLSGPAILKLSAWGARELESRQWKFAIVVNWLGEINEQALNEKLQHLRSSLGGQKMVNKNPFQLAARLWEYMLVQSGIGEETRWADLKSTNQFALLKNLCRAEMEVMGKTTYKEEFVTAGGIELKEIDPLTMESRKKPGIFFAGEIMDVDGVTGGFNFQHAWTSGYIAGKTIAERLK